MYRWMQLSVAESEELEEQGQVKKWLLVQRSWWKQHGRVHVDSNKILQGKADKEKRFGEHLRVQIEME